MALRTSIQNLIDEDVYGDIRLHDAKFLEGNNVITVDYLRDKFNEYTEDLDDNVFQIIRDDTAIRELFINYLIDAITSNSDVRTAYKNFLETLLQSEENILSILKQNHLSLVNTDTDVRQAMKDFLLELFERDTQIKSVDKSNLLTLINNDADIQLAIKRAMLRWIIFNDTEDESEYYDAAAPYEYLKSPYFVALIMDDDSGEDSTLYGMLSSRQILFGTT